MFIPVYLPCNFGIRCPQKALSYCNYHKRPSTKLGFIVGFTIGFIVGFIMGFIIGFFVGLVMGFRV